jgi:uncharacterized phage infection (PIP) family protein YhgE
MPELTWTTALAWFGVIAGAASVASLVAGLVGTYQTNRLIANIHAATRQTLTDMRKGFSETQERLGAILERMDQRADERHQEALQAIQALKR